VLRNDSGDKIGGVKNVIGRISRMGYVALRETRLVGERGERLNDREFLR